jgi:hypothetical protein
MAAFDRTPAGRYNALRNRARRKNYEFNLTVEQIAELTTMPCHYCGGRLPETGGGLDRIDNSAGYTADNVLPCCETCNSMRNNYMTVKETEIVVAALQEYRKTNEQS